MNIRCPNCQTVFRVDPARVPAAGIRARCSRCTETFFVQREQSALSGGTRIPTPSAAAASSSGAPARAPQATPPAAAPAPERFPTAQPVPRAVAGTPAGAAEGLSPGAPRTQAATAERSGWGSAAAPTAASRPGWGPPAAAPQAAPPPGAATAAPSVAKPAPQPPPTADAPRPHKFGSRDPDARAMRIARALVSDIIAYHPKRWESSRDAGSLRAEFREEIMKSWEEYVAQVGLELAKSTPHFRTALNDILARGQQIF